MTADQAIEIIKNERARGHGVIFIYYVEPLIEEIERLRKLVDMYKDYGA